MQPKWKGIIRQSSNRAQFVKILDTNEKKGVIEADCSESHESCETQGDERRTGNRNVCDAQTQAGVLLLIIHSVRRRPGPHKRLISINETGSKLLWWVLFSLKSPRRRDRWVNNGLTACLLGFFWNTAIHSHTKGLFSISNWSEDAFLDYGRKPGENPSSHRENIKTTEDLTGDLLAVRQQCYSPSNVSHRLKYLERKSFPLLSIQFYSIYCWIVGLCVHLGPDTFAITTWQLW